MSDVPPHARQKTIVDNLFKIDNDLQLHEGQSWYVISTDWISKWNEYIKEELPSISAMDNSELIERKVETLDGGKFGILKKGVVEKKDFILVSVETYNTFDRWFGKDETIRREVITLGKTNKMRIVELYPLVLKLVTLGDDLKPKIDKFKEIVISRSKDILTLQEKGFGLFEKFSKKKNDVRLWNIHNLANSELLSIPTQTLDEASIADGQSILFEFKKKDDYYYPLDDQKESKEEEGDDEDDNKKGGKGKKKKKKKKKKNIMRNLFHTVTGYVRGSDGMGGTPGVCGLYNLGNTCFMNSGIQCLSNCYPLTEYFLSGEYKKHINKKNPIGHKGKFAKKYGSLLNEMWSGYNSAVSPSDLKRTISDYAPQFSGYRQHDSQELLSFLIDGLHEDLNQIKSKPNVSQVESKGRKDEIVAKEAWDNHTKRNKSKIVEVFHGQLKSRVSCPKCHKISVTFDPYMFLSVPIPSERRNRISILLMKSTPGRDDFGKRPIKYSVEFTEKTNIGFLKQKFSDIISVDPQSLIFADMDFYRIKYKNGIVADNLKILQLKTRDKIIVQFKDNLKKQVYVKMMGRLIPDKTSESSETADDDIKGCGIPFIMPLPVKMKSSELYAYVYRYVRRFTKEGFQEKTFEKNNKKPFLVLSEVPKDYFQKGKVIPNNNTEIDLTKIECIAIDWLDHDYFLRKEAMTVNVESTRNSGGSRNRSVKLTDCLKLFSETEQLSKRNAWYCSNCKDHVEAYKKVEIFSLPQILIIHLKRFTYGKYFGQKIRGYIDFPIENLDLSKFTVKKSNDPILYDLFAVSEHSGGVGGGHYTASCKNGRNRRWYSFNDSSTGSCGKSSVQSSSAYVLFYERKNVEKKRMNFESGTSATPTTEDEEKEKPVVKKKKEGVVKKKSLNSDVSSNENSGDGK